MTTQGRPGKRVGVAVVIALTIIAFSSFVETKESPEASVDLQQNASETSSTQSALKDEDGSWSGNMFFMTALTMTFTLAAGLGALVYSRSVLSQSKTGPIPFPHKEEKSADVLIIGAGVVGSALAHALGSQGRKVIAIERDLSEPDRIVGELMQPGGVEQMKKLGLSHCFEGIDAPETHGYAVYSTEKHVILNYAPIQTWDESTNNLSSTKTIPHGRSFHHGPFVMNLRKAASQAPNVELRQGTVTTLIENDKSVVGIEYKDDDGNVTRLHAPIVVVCDGVHSRFRKQVVSATPSATSSFCGFVLENCELPYPDRGHVVLAEPSPVLAYPISSEHVRILVDVPHPLPSSSNGDLTTYLREKTAPQLPDAIRIPFLKAVEEKSVRSMPCSRLHPEVYKKPGLVMIGDAWNMRHPLTGGGMTVGLSDAVLLRDIIGKLKDIDDQGELVDLFARDFYPKRINVACSINVLAQALYNVFSSDPSSDPASVFMRDACFAYFELGGICVSGPMSLLAGTCTNAFVLIGHFFAVAFYGAYRLLFCLPWKEKALRSFQVLRAATNIIVPLLTGEHLLSFTYPIW